MSYYDIMVRNAFGSLRDIIREVSFSPSMARYLTYLRNKKYAYRGTYPDENYAREIMQLFSIGLIRLNPDGTDMLGSDGLPLETYDTDDIQTMARVWTGFDERPIRGNIAAYSGDRANNIIDPLQINAAWRDVLPKMDLLDNFLGDQYPLCSDLPARRFLRTGARYMYLGPQSWRSSGFITPTSTSSSLYTLLCDANGGLCRFPSNVVLASNLACHGSECAVDTVDLVQVVDATANVTVYYRHTAAACVHMQLFENPRAIKGPNDRVMCVDPTVPLAGTACCSSATDYNCVASPECEYAEERVTFATASMRCANVSKSLPLRHKHVSQETTCLYAPAGGAAGHKFTWLTRSCALQIQVDSTGLINMIHSHPRIDGQKSPSEDPDIPETEIDSHNLFRVGWAQGNFPQVGTTNCSFPACTNHADTCVCDTSLVTVAVFADPGAIPSRAQALSSLHMGAAAPDVFDSGVYTRCTSAPCNAQHDVELWTRGSADSPQLDTTAIFKVATDHGVVVHLANKLSTVSVGDEFSFRSPPGFMKMPMQTAVDAHYETEAAIDHLFHHPNTAPFIAKRLIQRFTSSNPSPRYVQVVSTAFTTGQYSSHSYGSYGSLAATIAAILLDREARSSTLQLDTTHGQLREPLLKLVHVMRSMEFASRDDREIELNGVQDRLEQMAHFYPSVFNFYLPEFQPPGPIGKVSTVTFLVLFYCSITARCHLLLSCSRADLIGFSCFARGGACDDDRDDELLEWDAIPDQLGFVEL